MSALDRLAQIEARTNAATNGPWIADPLEGDLDSANGTRVAEVGMWRDADAEFIAAAREDVPALVAALRSTLDLARRADGYAQGMQDAANATGYLRTDDLRRAIEGALR